MRWTKKEIIPSIIVAALLVPYAGYILRGSMPFIQDARGMAGTGVFLLLAWAFIVREPFERGTLAWVAGAIGVVALGLGVAAAWVESDALLALFVAAIILLWALRVAFPSPEQEVGHGSPTHA